MQIQSFGARRVLVALMVLPLASCQYVDQLKAIAEIQDAHLAYQTGNYQAAAELYEHVLANDPSMTDAYFYLANSYDSQYRPARRGERENDEYLEKAIDNYVTSVDSTIDPLRTLSLQYLVAAFGPEKANDPGAAEPVLRLMIDTDPSNPDNYFALAKVYEDSGLYEEAEQVFLQVANLRADDPAVYLQLAGFYNRNEEFDKTIEALRNRATLEPDNPEAFHQIATYYWEKAFRDFRLDDEQKEAYVMLGLAEEDNALALNADYVEALIYKGILLRIQANLTTDLELQEQLINDADVLRDRANELNKLRTAGAG